VTLALAACAPPTPEPVQGARRDALSNRTDLLYPFDFARLPTTTPTLVVRADSVRTLPITIAFQWHTTPQTYLGTTQSVPGAESGGVTRYTLSSAQALAVGTTIYWRAIASDAMGQLGISEDSSFTVGAAGSAVAWQATGEGQFAMNGAALLRTTPADPGSVIVGFEPNAVFLEDFEAGNLSAWTLSGVAPPTYDITNAVGTAPPSGTRVMKVVDLDGAGAGADAMHDFGAPLGRGSVAFLARLDAPGPRFSVGYDQGSGFRYSAALVWRGNPPTLRYVDASSAIQDLVPPVQVDLGVWHKYRIDYADTGVYDLFFEGMRVGQGLPFQSSMQPLTRVLVSSSSVVPDLINDFELDEVTVLRGALTGLWASPAIRSADVGHPFTLLEFSAVAVTGQSVSLQVEYEGQPGAWSLVPDAELPGNSAGFTTSPVALNTVPHRTLRVRATLSRAAVADPSPRLDSVTVTGSPAGPVVIDPKALGVDAGFSGFRFTASGGAPPYAYALAAAPSGGTIDRAGTYAAGLTCDTVDVVTVADALGATDTAQVTVAPCPGGFGGGAGGAGGSGGAGASGGAGDDPLALRVGCGCAGAPSGLWLTLLLALRRRRARL
jgi:hypothetical protein